MALPAYPRMRGRLTDVSGTIANGGTSQLLVKSNANRDYLFIQNNHASADLWINFAMAATQSQPSIRLAAGACITFEGCFIPMEDVTVIGGTTTQPFTAKEG